MKKFFIIAFMILGLTIFAASSAGGSEASFLNIFTDIQNINFDKKDQNLALNDRFRNLYIQNKLKGENQIENLKIKGKNIPINFQKGANISEKTFNKIRTVIKDDFLDLAENIKKE